MNKARNLVEMGDFYASTILTESSKKYNKEDFGNGSFAKAGKKTSDAVLPKGFKTKAYDKRGPLSNENEKSLVKPLEAKDAKGKKTFTGVEKLSLAPEKMEVETINNSMNKSIFDRLYEDVMSDNINSPEAADQHDAEALDLPGHDHEEDGGGDEVTITLSKELAGKLHDALMAVLGSDEEQHGEDEFEGEGESEEDAEEHEGNAKLEATELTELPPSTHEHLRKVSGRANVVGDTTSKLVDGKKGEGKINDAIDAEGKEIGNRLIGSGIKADTTSVKAKDNEVKGAKASKVGAYVAGLK